MNTIEADRPRPHIARIVIDAPPANALDLDACTKLREAVRRADDDGEVRVIIIGGRGKTFCAGADLRADGRLSGELITGFMAALAAVADCKTPILAAINGACLGGGLELALRCDLRIASNDAFFVCSGVNVGLIASAVRLPRLIGEARAKSMLLTGLAIDAAKAEAWGLVTARHAPLMLVERAIELAEQIAARAPLAVAAAKRVANAALDSASTAEQAQALELEVLLRSDDHREAIAAFRERRRPTFKGS